MWSVLDTSPYNTIGRVQPTCTWDLPFSRNYFQRCCDGKRRTPCGINGFNKQLKTEGSSWNENVHLIWLNRCISLRTDLTKLSHCWSCIKFRALACQVQHVSQGGSLAPKSFTCITHTSCSENRTGP